MKIHRDIAQGSVDWELLRAGKVTASEMDSLITPLGKIRSGEGVKTYLTKKVAEIWLGGPLPSANFWDGEQGQFLEEIAKPAFTLQTGMEIENVAFISSDDERAGCSPDGILGDSLGLELKCPHIETHIRYLLDGKLPPDYIAQVQGSMFVTGFKQWKFCSFRRNFPLFILTIDRDEEFCDSLGEAISLFNEDVSAALGTLTRLNGGPPKQRAKPVPTPATSDYEDVTP